MRKLLFPLFLFLGLVAGGILLQHEAGKRRTALENSLGGARVGVPLETAAAFARQLESVSPDAPEALLRAPLPDPVQPAVAASEDDER